MTASNPFTAEEKADLFRRAPMINVCIRAVRAFDAGGIDAMVDSFTAGALALRASTPRIQGPSSEPLP
jgi:hypothetical protein